MSIIRIIKSKVKEIRLSINRIGSRKKSAKIIDKDVTLISNNCWAGIVYEHLGLEFRSPTIGMFIMPKDYIKFCKNLGLYIEHDLKFIKPEQSRYKKFLVERKIDKCVIGKLNDIEIFFLHYKDEKEAYEKWNRRKKRINFNNIIYKFNDQNECTDNDLELFDNLDLKKKIIFSSKKHVNLKCNIWIKKYRRLDCIKEDYYSCYKYIDIIKFINEGV